MNKELKFKSNRYKFNEINIKGITLISLVITIIVLIILASVGIYLSLGNNGIFTRAKESKELTNRQTATEKINLKITNCQINKYAEKQEMPTLKELSISLRDDNEIQYVTEKSQIASTKYEVGENPISIYTKLNEYPYEFEINGQLQLASINGIKLANTNEQTINQPIGIKTESYIKNQTNKTTAYKNLTSMSGITINEEKEGNNKIDEYLSYSKEDGYTVLKSGWYFIDFFASVYSSTNAGTGIYLIINDKFITGANVWTSTTLAYDRNSFSIVLNKGDKIYFASDGSGNVTQSRNAEATLYPMF